MCYKCDQAVRLSAIRDMRDQRDGKLGLVRRGYVKEKNDNRPKMSHLQCRAFANKYIKDSV